MSETEYDGQRPDGAATEFTTTRWSVVLLAREANSTVAREALSELCRVYWYPLYAFVRRTGHSPHDAQDLVQEYFARLIEGDWLRQVDERKGRFRSFLLSALKHFLANEWDRIRALKRGGAHRLLSLDETQTENRYRLEPSHCDSPDRLYERRWAMTLLETVLARLEQEYRAEGKATIFEELKHCLAGSRETPAYAELAPRLGVSVGATKVMVHRFRQRYRELLRDHVSQTVSEVREVDEELQYLMRALRP
jgi:RNA polymerase sigma-70 factor (ECF subfamily)